MCTLTGDVAFFWTIAATAVAQAPVPQASVIPGAALPGAEVDAIVADRGDIDVDPLGKGRVMLDRGPCSSSRSIFVVGDEKHQVRVADAKGHRMLERVPGERQFAVSIG